jgi:hypothetical protein
VAYRIFHGLPSIGTLPSFPSMPLPLKYGRQAKLPWMAGTEVTNEKLEEI